MATTPVALILGSGPRVGAAVAQKFASEGYKVATASRKGTGSKDDQGLLSLKADLEDPKSIPFLFQAVQAEFNSFPSVVVYNAAALTPPPDAKSVLSISEDSFTKDLKVNTISAYVAAQESVKAWASTAQSDTKKTFIYTGNGLNVFAAPVPVFLNLAVGKSASAAWVGIADALYSSQGVRFFYADERFSDGKNKGLELDGPAHADFYSKLAKHEGNVPWHATFVKDKGYTKF